MKPKLILLFYINIVFLFPTVYSQDTIQKTVLSLVQYYDKAISDDGEVSKQLFFDVFPDNFQIFNSIYGWNNQRNVPQYLYDSAYNHIIFFCKLSNNIPTELYYKKMINICLNAHWEADAINYFQNCMQTQFLTNIDTFLSVLGLYDDPSIKKFWHFFFDSPYFDHPFQLALYDKVHTTIMQNERIFLLMQEQYSYDKQKYLMHKKEKECD